MELFDEIANLPSDWHGAGSLSPRVLELLGRHARGVTLETGCGKSTLLLSHHAEQHLVFAKDDAGDGNSLSVVQGSPLLNREKTRFVVGPTQVTLPAAALPLLDLALLDGPHGYPFPELEYYYVYPRLKAGATLVIDDIHIATVGRLFRFLCEDDMFTVEAVVDDAAFFRRTSAPTFDPLADGWWLQGFNARRRGRLHRLFRGL